MTPRISCITLPVDDVALALAFYRDGLGLPVEGVDVRSEDDHMAIALPGGLYLVLILRPGFSRFTALAGQTDAGPGTSECILSYFAPSRDEVDSIMERAASNGGSIADAAAEQEWGYAGYLRDPDGHLWEIMYNEAFVKIAQEMN